MLIAQRLRPMPRSPVTRSTCPRPRASARTRSSRSRSSAGCPAPKRYAGSFVAPPGPDRQLASVTEGCRRSTRRRSNSTPPQPWSRTARPDHDHPSPDRPLRGGSPPAHIRRGPLGSSRCGPPEYSGAATTRDKDAGGSSFRPLCPFGDPVRYGAFRPMSHGNHEFPNPVYLWTWTRKVGSMMH